MTKMTPYSEFIAKSRYSRFLPEMDRREHWEETVNRYTTFIYKHLQEKHDYKMSDELYRDIRDAIVGLEVMPSMRAIMTAGKALERDNTAGYNCSYLPIDDPKAFDEAMYILLCGTGVGFSVEHKYVDQLPEVPDQLFDSETVISVADSKEGWAKALRQLIALLYSGEVARYDLSKIRPAGARLKTFGGRASGPGPLDELFKFTTAKFRTAAGRKLTSIECHDILCKIGEVVVVGGVRRSAMISLSDLEDDRMRGAKSGDWWIHNGQRALANNSATYVTKPDIGQFLAEWTSLYNSHSGERGIFSRAASKTQAKKNGRRDGDFDFGTNPCSEIILRPYQFCNLTEVVVRADDTVESLSKKVRIATILGTFQSTLTHFPYLRKIWQKNTEEERLLGVSLTGILDNHWMGEVCESTAENLEQLRKVAVDTNSEFATILGIPQSTAITCVKPSGTVSQLVDSASGIHARHSRYYIRRVRGDKKDPLSQFLAIAGIPAEDCVMRPDSTVVFSFPMKAPEGARLRDDLTALEHLDLWLMYQRHWCEHKPSVTISVKEDEWMDVGAWVWRHFDEVSGVSFLPWDGGSYRQAPYEECSKEVYEELLAKMPKEIYWDTLSENDDNVEGAQTLACVAGHCEI
jgi:ribonucleoside-triphosphate reductase